MKNPALAAHERAEVAAVFAVGHARKARGVVLIHVTVPANVRLPGYSWWDVPVSATSKLPGVRAARARYDRTVKTKQRFYY